MGRLEETSVGEGIGLLEGGVGETAVSQKAALEAQICYTLLMIQKTFSDTSSEVEDILITLLRQAPAWRKFKMVGDLNATVKQFALDGIRQRHPNATDQELNRRLADLLLGEELAAKAYGEWHEFQSA